MGLKDITDIISDYASAGVVIGRKLLENSMGDERNVDAGAVGEMVAHLHPDRLPVKVAEMFEETSSTKTLRLVPAGEEPLPPFRAGQFFTVFLDVDGVLTSRAYSVSSPPCHRGHIDITVRRMPDGFVSAYLCERAAVGDTFEVAGPGGTFYHETLADTGQLVFLAGGSGITPFMSMIREKADTAAGPSMQLLYGSRVTEDVIFWDELSSLACSLDGFSMDLVVSEPPDGFDGLCGLLDAEMILNQIGSIEGKTFFICGPHAMYGLCLPALDTMGVPHRRIKSELSGPPPDVTLVDGWPGADAGAVFKVKLDGTRKSIKAVCGEPLLNSLERNGITIDNLCRSGECGVCRTRLVEGEVFMPLSVVRRKSDVLYGYIHPCMSYPLSDITIRL